MITKIGLFDSGVGGLTVLREMVQALPGYQFVYLGDTARLPYGSKSPETLEKYVKQNIEFLKKQQVGLVISACHTASSVILKHHLKCGIPLFEVITPSCEEALRKTRNNKVGLLGTVATVKSAIYLKTLQELEPEVKVFQQSSPLLVPLVESGWINDPITDEILKRYINPLLEKGIDSLILGCTHYPLLAQSIARLTNHSLTLINPATALANQLSQELPEPAKGTQPSIEVFLTDHSPHFLEHSRSLMGEEISSIMKLHSPDIT